MVLTWILYICCLVVVVVNSSKIASIIDALDKKTKLSGAILGTVLLAGVTSLPELVTSVTAAILGETSMTLGNILGSNIFDMAIIGVLMVVFCARISQKNLSKSNTIFAGFTLLVSVLVLICTIFGLEIVIPGVNINVLTPIIILLYALALFSTRKEEPKDDDNKEMDVPNKYQDYSVKKLWLLFALFSVVLVCVSIGITFITEKIADTYSLGRGLAGALFLGVATSLPEIIASVQLIRLGNFDAAYGDIIGSCLFNFGIVSIADIIYTSGTVFVTDPQSLVLAACLSVAALLMFTFAIIRRKAKVIKNSKAVQFGFGALITASYVTFLIISTLIL